MDITKYTPHQAVAGQICVRACRTGYNQMQRDKSHSEWPMPEIHKIPSIGQLLNRLVEATIGSWSKPPGKDDIVLEHQCGSIPLHQRMGEDATMRFPNSRNWFGLVARWAIEHHFAAQAHPMKFRGRTTGPILSLLQRDAISGIDLRPVE